MARAAERFALLDQADEPLGLWAGFAPQPLQLEGDLLYRVDYLEIHPDLRRRGLGALLVCCVAARALELGCTGVVLGSLPSAAPYWEKFGDPRRPHGWRCAAGLTPFVIQDKLPLLGRVFHELLAKSP